MGSFDLKSALLARHAQHVVLVHFPIGLFLTAVAFDYAAQWTRKAAFSTVSYYNFSVAAFSSLAAVVTGLLAWRWQLEGQHLRGVLLLHLLLGSTSSVFIVAAWWMHRRARSVETGLPRYRLVVEAVGALVVAATGHLGGFLSGVNG